MSIACLPLVWMSATAPPLRLPPPPEMPAVRFESSPPNARIESTARFDLFEPWLLGGVGAAHRFTSPSSSGVLAEARVAIPFRVYGSGRTGLGFALTGSVQSVGSLPDHGSAGLAFGLLEDRRDRVTPPSAFVILAEMAAPFRHTEGASAGPKVTALFMARGPYVSLSYLQIPTDGATVRGVMVGVGVDFVQAL